MKGSSKKMMAMAQSMKPLKIGDKIVKQYFRSHVRCLDPVAIHFDEPTRVETVIWTSRGAKNRAEQNITTDFAPAVSVEAWRVKVVASPDE
jgi:hypothetical protein